ncbi:PREDICTED: melatonin receptor type 1A-like [Gekko japonicus]|uniref:Melatonin receptor type 1A-like n=1 Tax=Gekko japonicus TaxID=146911 RepID=A0ABM1KAN5_GEKJA|nr:PREDICTED: melatonin receptor type 1A-like [Gekko japonicus]
MDEAGLLPRNGSAAGLGGKEELYPAWVASLLAAILILTIAVDILGNILVILSVYKNKKLRKAGNAFVVSLAVADLLAALYPFPLALIAIFHDNWVMGGFHCQMSGFLMGMSVISSVFNITGIAINRYCYICHSLKYDRLFSYHNTLCYVGLVWALTLLAIMPNLFVESLKYDPRVYSCTFSQSVSSLYTIMVVVIHFFLPITIVSYCYLRIWILVLQVRRRVKPDVQPRIKPHDFWNFLTMFMVFVLFAICWAPLNLVGFVVALKPTLDSSIPKWLFTASYFMAYFNSCLNAVIYGVLNHSFRKEYKRIMLTLCQTPAFRAG